MTDHGVPTGDGYGDRDRDSFGDGARRVADVHAAVLAWWAAGATAPTTSLAARVRNLTTPPGGHIGEIAPDTLGAFARFLFEYGPHATRREDQHHAVLLLEEAARRWSAPYGPPHLPPLQLASYHLDLYDYRGPARLLACAREAAEVLRLTSDPDPRLSAHLLRAVVRAELLQRGADTGRAEVARRFREEAVDHTGLPPSREDWPGVVERLTGRTLSLTKLLRHWHDGAGSHANHAAHALVLLRFLPVLDPDRTVPVGQLDALTGALDTTDATARRHANMVTGVALGHYGSSGFRPLLGRAAEAAESANGARHTGDDSGGPTAGQREAVAGMEAVIRMMNGILNGGRVDYAEGMRKLTEVADRMGTLSAEDRAGLPDDDSLRALLTVLSARSADGRITAEQERAISGLRPEDMGMDPGHPAWTALMGLRNVTDRPAGPGDASPGTGGTGGPGGHEPGAGELVRSLSGMPSTQRGPLLFLLGATRYERSRGRGDLVAIRDAAVLLRACREVTARGDDAWICAGMLLSLIGYEEAALGRPWSRRRRVDEAVRLMEETYESTRGPEHPLRGRTGYVLAKVRRLRDDPAAGDREASRRIARDALQATAYSVLLQSGTDDAAAVAGAATATALMVARWCLADGVPAEAVTALDACRGLALHAATTARTVEARLTEAGRADLAARWARAGAVGGPMASELRREVLGVLIAGGGSPADRLLSPPDTRQVAAALGALGHDALVYLLPAPAPAASPAVPAVGSGGSGGAAVVVSADGRVGVVPLPGLRTDAEPLRQYLDGPVPGGPPAPPPADPARSPGQPGDDADLIAAFAALDRSAAPGPGHPRRARDMGPATGSPTRVRPLSQRLDRLCGWAWNTVTGPLTESVRRAVPLPAGTRPPRLVLVPMGELSAVPWHAAWRTSSAGRRFAVEEAQFTYAASARLFCEVAGRPERPRTGAALIVGDPTGDLSYAGREAVAIHHAYYPDALFLGRGDGPGTGAVARPAEVLGWFRSGAGRGGTVHLACHATVVENARHSAALILREGVLAAEELTEPAGAADDSGHPDLVVLAACRSHVSGRGSNEAYTLATAFLTAGARSVIGSLWPVPDEATSLLMFMTHHYLRTTGRGPAEALRLAQRWMLDPNRAVPPQLPPDLAASVRTIDPDDLSSWAGFILTGR